MNLFDVLPKKFFNILSSKNQEIYSDCIFLIFQIMDNFTSFGVERDVLVDALSAYFEEREDFTFVDDDEVISGARNSAQHLIRKLNSCGWIDLETNNNYVEYVNFFDYAISFIESMDKLIRNERLEYQGYVFAIYSLLFSSESNQPGVMLEQVYENTRKLLNGLKSLNSNIRNYIDKITRLKTAEEILHLQFNDYEVNIIDKGYHRLKTSDNVSKFRPRIIEKLEEILRNPELIQIISKQFVEMEKANTFENAYELTLNKLNETIKAFNNIDEIIRDIDHKHYQYLRASLARVKFVLNSKKDLSGQINAILKYIISIHKSDQLDLNEDLIPYDINIIDVFPQNFIDQKSLYVATEGKKAFIPQNIDENLILTKQEREQRIKKFKDKNKERMNKNYINDYVLSSLGSLNVINASQLPLNNILDFIKIIYILVYSKSKLVNYYVKGIEKEIMINGYTFYDFEIWRK